MSWGERSFFFHGAGSKDPPPPPMQVCTMRFGKQVIILSGKLRFEHLFSNIMIWFG